MPEILELPIDTIIARYQAGEKFEPLATEYGCSAWALRARFKARGIASRPRGVPHGSRKGWYCMAELDAAAVIMMYRSRVNMDQIAAMFGVHRKTIQRCLRRNNVPAIDNWRWPVDDNYFETIDTEAKAYWLGMLMADGHVDKDDADHYRVRLCLKDKEHVEKFKAAIQTEAPVSEIVRVIKGKTRRYYAVDVSSQKMRNDLIQHGVVPQKTCNHGTPELRPDLMRHFYRGYVDGDGCLYIDQNRDTSSLFVLGYASFLEQFRVWLLSRLGAELKGPLNAKFSGKGKARRFNVCSKYDAALISHFLYATHTIALERKAQKARDMMSLLQLV